MGPKTNKRATAANERKNEQAAEKNDKLRSAKEKLEQADWAKGSKDSAKKDELERKRLEELQKKEELKRLLAEEEEGLAKMKQGKERPARRTIPEFSATGVEDAISLLDLTQDKHAKIDRHPERRAKSAYAAFEEREMAIIKQENPTLRLTQMKQMLQKKWKKSPENPLNQQRVAFDATREQVQEFKDKMTADALDSFKQ